ncbi:universal stress protein UspE [Paraphotobacterium marinum]
MKNNIMDKYKNILVVIDPEKKEQISLKKAFNFALKEKDVKIEVLMVIYDFSFEMTSMISKEERHNMRDAVLKQQKNWIFEAIKEQNEHNFDVSISVLWHNRPFEAIINHVIDNKNDLVIKATHHHDKLGSLIFTPTDWHLLRKCPSPLLLVKNLEWQPGQKIVSSVHVGSENKDHIKLNSKIVAETIKISKILDGEVNLLNSYPPTPVNITVEIPEFDPNTYSKTMRNHHILGMKALRQNFGLPEEKTFVLEGIPSDIIPQFCDDHNAEVVVLGTTGRTGLSAVFIGNTAESIIDKVKSDVLAIKPDGYVSPLDPENLYNS